MSAPSPTVRICFTDGTHQDFAPYTRIGYWIIKGLVVLPTIPDAELMAELQRPERAELLASLMGWWRGSKRKPDKMGGSTFHKKKPLSTKPSPESILELAVSIFENETVATEWLNQPNLATDEKPPIALLGTEDGFLRVETLLHRIDHGVLA